MKITNKITKSIFVSCTVLALIFGSFSQEVNAQNVTEAPGGSTGWEPVSTTNESDCAAKAGQKMSSLVSTGLIKTVTGASSRYARGNAVFNIVCHKDGKYVRVDIICFGACVNDTYDIRSQIEKMLRNGW